MAGSGTLRRLCYPISRTRLSDAAYKDRCGQRNAIGGVTPDDGSDSTFQSADGSQANETPDEAITELCELAELWIERRVLGQDNAHVSIAMSQAGQDVRRLERKTKRGASRVRA